MIALQYSLPQLLIGVPAVAAVVTVILRFSWLMVSGSSPFGHITVRERGREHRRDNGVMKMHPPREQSAPKYPESHLQPALESLSQLVYTGPCPSPATPGVESAPSYIPSAAMVKHIPWPEHWLGHAAGG